MKFSTLFQIVRKHRFRVRHTRSEASAEVFSKGHGSKAKRTNSETGSAECKVRIEWLRIRRKRQRLPSNGPIKIKTAPRPESAHNSGFPVGAALIGSYRLSLPTRPVCSFFDKQPHTLSRLEAATRPYQKPESFIVRFWLRKSV